MTDVDCGRLTDPAFWNEMFHDVRTPVIRASHPSHGRNGFLVRMVHRRLGDLRGARVLELGGGGQSHLLLAMHKWCGARVWAVDFSPVALDLLQRVFAANGGQVSAHQADFFTWDPGPLRFDVVVHWGVLEHFERPQELLARCRELLAPGGRVLFSMPNMRGLPAYFWKRWAPIGWSHHVYHDAEAVRQACDSAGLRLVEHFHFGPPAIGAVEFERGGPGPAALRLLQKALNAASLVLPYDRWGCESLSASRGFVAERAGPVEEQIPPAAAQRAAARRGPAWRLMPLRPISS